MRDGLTRKIETPAGHDSLTSFLKLWRVMIVSLTGDQAGTEYALDRPCVTMGRGPDTDLTFDDEAMSKEHAVLEFDGTGFRVRDLGSMNGLLLNGSEIRVAELKNGDRFELGEHAFQYLLDRRPHEPKAYVLPDE